MATNTSYSSQKVEMKDSPISGRGLFTKERIKKGELVISFVNGKGRFVDAATAEKLYDSGNDHMIQVDDDSFFVAYNPGDYEKEDHLNHSCDPNLGIRGSMEFVAIRDIEIGEELTFDYAMSDSSDYKMECRCGSKNCRKIITGEDWRIPELQNKYLGYFSEYLGKKIL